MTPAIPPDARKVVLAAVVPCDKCKGTGCDELTVADYEAAGIDIDLDDDDLGTPEYADDCFDCDGTGTRTVVAFATLTEVRHVLQAGIPWTEGRNDYEVTLSDIEPAGEDRP